MDYYLLTADNKHAGPYSIDQMRTFWASGQLTRATPYWAPGMTEWRGVGALEFILKPVQTQPLGSAASSGPPPKKSWSRRIVSACLALLLIPSVIAVALMVLGLVVRSSFDDISSSGWPPKEITISDEVSENNRGNFVLCSPKAVQSWGQDSAVYQKGLEADGQSMAEGLSFEAASKMHNWYVQRENQALQDGTGIAIPAGVYKVTGFLDIQDGHELKEIKQGQTVYAAVSVNGRTLYRIWCPMTAEFEKGVVQEALTRIPNDTQPKVLTKDQWKAAVPGARLVMLTNVLQCNKADLFAAVGPPSHTSTMGNDVYLYWNCRDGTIQVNCSNAQYVMGGYITGGVSDY